jgi:O-antigen ligase
MSCKSALATTTMGRATRFKIGCNDGGSAASRVPMALGALGLIEQRPLFGVGLNNYADALARLDRLGFAR